jgi:hypothetical protein
VAAFSGIVALAGWMIINWNDTTDTEQPTYAIEWMMVGLAGLLYLFLFMVVAMIPAGLVALAYCKLGIGRSVGTPPPA